MLMRFWHYILILKERVDGSSGYSTYKQKVKSVKRNEFLFIIFFISIKLYNKSNIFYHNPISLDICKIYIFKKKIMILQKPK